MSSFFLFCFRPHTLQTGSNTRSLPSTVMLGPCDMSTPYVRQFIHSKSQQYRRLKTEWRNNVYLRRSNIQVSIFIVNLSVKMVLTRFHYSL